MGIVTVVRLFLRFVREAACCLYWDVQDRLGGHAPEWGLLDVIGFCWDDFLLRVRLSRRAAQYERRMRRRRVREWK